MSDYHKQIGNLNRKLFFKFNKIKVVPDEKQDEKTIEEFVGGMGFAQHYGGNSSTSPNSNRDVGNAAANDQAYTTHKPHAIIGDHPIKSRPEEECPDDDPSCNDQEEDENTGGINIDIGKAKQGIGEAEGDVPMPEPEPGATEDPPPEEMGAEPDMAGVDDMGGGDPAMGDMSDPGLGDPNAGMPGEEPPKDPNELGRTYEMKKIYARLVSMNEYLADERSPKIVKTKTSIAKAIDLFAVIGANPESYKEKIDEIIVSYYKFLEAAYRRVKAFYKSEARRVGGMPEVEDESFEKKEEQKDDMSTEVTI